MLRSVGLEVAAKAGIQAVTTSTTGANFAQLPSVVANQVVIYNGSAVSLDVQYCDNGGNARGGAETFLPVPAGTAQPFRGLSNAQQLQVRRSDNSNTPVTVKFTYESV